MFWDIIIKVLKTIILVPLALVSAICLIPVVAILLIIGLPLNAIEHVWGRE